MPGLEARPHRRAKAGTSPLPALVWYLREPLGLRLPDRPRAERGMPTSVPRRPADEWRAERDPWALRAECESPEEEPALPILMFGSVWCDLVDTPRRRSGSGVVRCLLPCRAKCALGMGTCSWEGRGAGSRLRPARSDSAFRSVSDFSDHTCEDWRRTLLSVFGGSERNCSSCTFASTFVLEDVDARGRRSFFSDFSNCIFC
mmetsp:Transcript_126167/g.403789  ORF Transcript_126167/g.403789 Transcript_126167/m.403789 type:complete len:202 (+) Transcript_126167:463-1068(+)